MIFNVQKNGSVINKFMLDFFNIRVSKLVYIKLIRNVVESVELQEDICQGKIII